MADLNDAPLTSSVTRRPSLIVRLGTNLTFWVLLAMVAGIGVGLFEIPLLKPWLHWIKSNFISITTCFIYPLVFLTISIGIASMGSLWSVGRVGFKALLYFEIVTTIALLIGVAVALLIQPGKGVQRVESTSAQSSLAGIDHKPDDKLKHEVSLKEFFLHNRTLQVLFVALGCGIFFNFHPSGSTWIPRLESILHWVFIALRWFMYSAPIAAFAGMALTINEQGTQVLWSLLKLMLTVYATMFFFIGVFLNFLMWRSRVSLWRFLKYLRQELMLVLGTSSSESALPSLMAKLEGMGCSKTIVGLVVPTGYSFNLDGTTIYLSLSTLFLMQAYDQNISLSQLLMIIGVLMVTSKGAAGVTGAGFTLLVSTLKAVPIVPVESAILLFGVDRLLSEARSITNFIGNGVATVYLASHENQLDRQAMEKAFAESP